MAKFLDEEGLKVLWKTAKSSFYDSASGKAVRSDVDGILTGDKPLVTPVIASASWQKYKNDGTTAVGDPITTTNVTIENGYKVKFTGTWKWTADSAKKNPTNTTGTWGTTLPASGTASATYTAPTAVGENISFSQKVTAPQAGLVYENGKIHKPASGATDATACTATATFGYAIFYGFVAGPISLANIKKCGSTISNSVARTVTANRTGAEMLQQYVYAYPASMGDLKAISKDGVESVLTAFNKTTISYTNDSGAAAVTYNVYYTAPDAVNQNCTFKFE